MEEIKINAVQCGECGTNSPRFFIKCKKCGKTLDSTDKKIYEERFDEKKAKQARWTPTSLIVFVIVFGVLFYFALKILNVGNHNSISKETSVSSELGTNGVLTKSEFISKVKENQNVVDADITDVNFLYISVINDGNNKDAMAVFYCRLAKQYNVSEVKAVKIVDAASAILPKDGTASGNELGKSFCD